MNAADSEQALAAADLCRFVSACFYEPTDAFSEERLFASMQAAARLAYPALLPRIQALETAFAQADLQTLLVDYTRLFIGPVQPPARPYGSVWLTSEDVLMHDSTLAVLDLYRDGGFEIDESVHELPDHVAVELEFLYLLDFNIREARSREPTDRAEVARLEALRTRLLSGHLGRWIGPFSQALQAAAECDFYRELAGLAAALVQLEQHRATAVG